ncbi:hypothetical protein [Deinococcus psychrotolerans]|nr:hypothetical protein [Deinococcus psychrotolerans]
MTTLDHQVLDQRASAGAAIFGSAFVEILNPSGSAVCLTGFTTRL